MDANQDGVVSKEEFLEAHKKMEMRNKNSRGISQRKKILLTKISPRKNRMQKPTRNLKKFKNEPAQKIVLSYIEKKYDANLDGKLSTEETLSMIRDHNKSRKSSAE